jgi:hypothetical protein
VEPWVSRYQAAHCGAWPFSMCPLFIDHADVS